MQSAATIIPGWVGRHSGGDRQGCPVPAQPWASYITGVCLNVSGGMEFGTTPKYYAFDASAEKMKQDEAMNRS
jgi:hypothetical protein